jgi:hypothetical protein
MGASFSELAGRGERDEWGESKGRGQHEAAPPRLGSQTPHRSPLRFVGLAICAWSMLVFGNR